MKCVKREIKMLKNEYPNFPITRLITLASVLFNTKTGGYISWELDEDAEKPTWDFREDGVYLFTLNEDSLVTHTEGKEFILYEEENSIWLVRPFFEIDVTNYLLAYGTNDYSDDQCVDMFKDIQNKAQEVIDDASIF